MQSSKDVAPWALPQGAHQLHICAIHYFFHEASCNVQYVSCDKVCYAMLCVQPPQLLPVAVKEGWRLNFAPNVRDVKSFSKGLDDW
jgi:hypothetical protein